MVAFTLEPLSESGATGTIGIRPIEILDTSAPGTAIHTASTVSGTIDEVHLWAAIGSSATIRLLVLSFGGTATGGNATGEEMDIDLSASDGYTKVIDGLLLNNGLNLDGWGTGSDGMTVHGKVYRRTQ